MSRNAREPRFIETIHKRGWHLVGRADEFTRSGAFRVFEVCSESVIVVRAEDGSLRVWDTETGQPLATYHADAPVLCTAVHTETLTIFAGDGSGRLHFLRFEEP